MNHDQWKLQASPTPHQGRPVSRGPVRDPEDIVQHIKSMLAVSRPPYRQCTQKGCRQPTRWKFGVKQIARCWDHRP